MLNKNLINLMNLDELQPKLYRVKSYYGKALMKKAKTGELLLYSYLQFVCWIDFDTRQFFLNSKIDEKYLYSSTTLRHIREFLYQFLGLENVTKQELIKHAIR